MPHSGVMFDEVFFSLIGGFPVRRCLDIGAGAGKYGKMIREKYPEAHISAIEIEEDYIERFGLREIYDEVNVMPAQNLLDGDLERSYDLIVVGDCLEHIKKSEGVDLLNFLVYRTEYLYVRYPEALVQGTWEGYRHEAHISVWSEADFVGFSNVVLKRNRPDGGIAVAVILDGYSRTREEHLPAGELLSKYLPEQTSLSRFMKKIKG